MNPAEWPGGLAYIVVFVAAVVEGEVVFVTACALVGAGRLDAAGVFIAAALGGSFGDQFWFYACRGRLRTWLTRIPRLEARRDAIVSRVQRRGAIMALACRFLPGLRIAIPAACAYADVPPVLFSTLNLVSAFAWAGTVMALVTQVGPRWSEALGLPPWTGLVVPAALVVLFFRWIGRATDVAAPEVRRPVPAPARRGP